jgi:bifunctional DNA-binding transcriptional regulator/antitoxin component of YhaV-PrlF toxin-antitoxin module
MTVTVKSKTEVIVPRGALRKAGIKTGDRVTFIPSAGTVTMLVERLGGQKYTTAERRTVGRMLTSSEKDRKEGRVYGPFNTAEELAASVEKNIKKLRMAKRKAKSAR